MHARRGFDPRFVPTAPVEIGGELPASTVYVPGVSLRDLGGIFPPLVAQSLATVAASSYGPALTSNSTGVDNSTGAEVLTGNYLGNIGQEVTIFWAGDQNATAPGGGSEIFGIEYDANGDAPYHTFALAIDGGDNIVAICGIGSNYYLFTSSGAWVAQSRTSWVATIQIGGNINLYQMGALLGTTTGLPTGTFATSTTSMLRLGNYNPSGYSNANNAVAGFYNGIWTPAQVAQFNAEPFATLRPVHRRTYFVPASAPATDTGAGADTLGAPTQSADGVLSVSGTATDATAPPSDAGSAAASATGAGSDATNVPSGAGVGSGSVSGSGAGAVPAPSDAGVGAVSISGSEMEILADASASGSGQVGANVSGSGAESAPGPTAAGVGAVSISGSEMEILAQASGSGAGSVVAAGEVAAAGAGSVAVAGAATTALTSEVPASRVIPLWPSPLRLPDKAASETMDYAIDASALLASPSDTLSVVAACPSLTVAQALAAGSQIVLLLGGGTSGADNAVDVQISAASGRFVHRIVRVLTQ